MTHWSRRAVGLAVLLLSIVPLYRQLPSRDTGLAGRSIAEIVSIQVELLWSGVLLLVVLAALAGFLLPAWPLARFESAVERALLRPSTTAFATGVGLVSALLTMLVVRQVLDARPNLADAVLQLTQARYMAAGQLGGPSDFAAGFWHMQNSVVTGAGWFSQYPPGHMALLALGYALGAVWLTGPLVMGATAALSVLVMQRLLPERAAVARAAGLAVGLSPFLMAQSAAYMNHSTAALLGVLAVYCALRARDGGMARGWAAGAGAAVAAMAAVRPVAAVATMIVVTGGIWLMPSSGARAAGAPSPAKSPIRRLSALAPAAILGGLPFLVVHLWYNRTAFGGFTVFGYEATWGPAHGLGFHRDPWGNTYGALEALFYTSADLAALNLNLMETLLPLVSLVGLYLVVARSLASGDRVLALWCLLPLLANALYWHHGYFMGPRMLADFAPAWVGLSVVSIHGLLRRVPDEAVTGSRFSPRVAASVAVIAGVGSSLIMGPQRLASYGGDWQSSFRAPAPAAPDSSVVFIHGTWEGRLVSRLTSQGLRMDIVETAVRQNPTCLVQRHADALRIDGRAFGAARPGSPDALPPLDLIPRAFEFLPRAEVARDVRIRLDPATRLHETCLREIHADRFGAMNPFFVSWLGDLPGIEEGKPLFATDLGPHANRRLLARYPDRSAWIYGYFTPGDSPGLLPYAEGMAVLWPER